MIPWENSHRTHEIKIVLKIPIWHYCFVYIRIKLVSYKQKGLLITLKEGENEEENPKNRAGTRHTS